MNVLAQGSTRQYMIQTLVVLVESLKLWPLDHCVTTVNSYNIVLLIYVLLIYEQQTFYERGKPDNIRAIAWICSFFLCSRRII